MRAGSPVALDLHYILQATAFHTRYYRLDNMCVILSLRNTEASQVLSVLSGVEAAARAHVVDCDSFVRPWLIRPRALPRSSPLPPSDASSPPSLVVVEYPSESDDLCTVQGVRLVGLPGVG